MDVMLFAPELFLLLGSLLLFLFTLSESTCRNVRGIAIALGIGAVFVTLSCLNLSGDLFQKAYRVDLFSQLFKLAIAAGFLLVVVFGRQLKGIAPPVRPEYYLFLTLSCMGLMMLVSSVELISLFVSLELSSFALYILVPLRDDSTGLRTQMESGIKYMLYGVVATGIMLFGMSYLFGLTGSTHLQVLLPRLHAMAGQPAVIVALAMVLCGFFFKLAVFPFHFWVPDVYQGASNETAAFIAAIPKLGAVAMLIRIMTLVTPADKPLLTMLAILAVCSMFYGNLAALMQKDVKRMLGFSGIAHAGFILLGLLTLKEAGFAASVYYIMGYLVMNLACFLVICTVSKNGENVLIDDLAGLHKRSPLLAFTLTVGLFALAGIPPFVGFMGKFFLLASALNAGHLTVVILAAINTAIAIYYYLSVVKVAYCNAPDLDEPMPVDVYTQAVSVVLILAIIAFGVLPGPIMAIASAAVHTIL